MELRDQGFRVGDKVVFMRKNFIPALTTVGRATYGHFSICVEGYSDYFSTTGQIDVNQPQRLFHRDAVTIDKHGRLTAINHDYVKPRAPKIVTKEPSEFAPFEKVLVRGTFSVAWHCLNFSHYKGGDPFPFKCGGSCWLYCIPFVGNEHLVGKVTE